MKINRKFLNRNIPKSPLGLYKYPNSIVDVPTDGPITMKGINYPVLGVSDKGEYKMMYPNKEYNFKKGTRMVREFPINKRNF